MIVYIRNNLYNYKKKLLPLTNDPCISLISHSPLFLLTYLFLLTCVERERSSADLTILGRVTTRCIIRMYIDMTSIYSSEKGSRLAAQDKKANV